MAVSLSVWDQISSGGRAVLLMLVAQLPNALCQDCPTNIIVAAVLGTFFSTIVAVLVVLLTVYLVHRRNNSTLLRIHCLKFKQIHYHLCHAKQRIDITLYVAVCNNTKILVLNLLTYLYHGCVCTILLRVYSF